MADFPDWGSGGGGGGAYASLTGPGQTATPGNLTQAGVLFVSNTAVTPPLSAGIKQVGGQLSMFTLSDNTNPDFLEMTGDNLLLVGTGEVLIQDSGSLSAGGLHAKMGGPISVQSGGGISIGANNSNVTTASNSLNLGVASGGVVRLNTGGNGNLNFFGGAGSAKQTATGSKAGNAALASVCTILANYGLITDSTT